ncbi:MAG: biopolymer transporter ExbD [Spirochaetaceae bacterium]|jgi:biopolymer transport protein ExbD|nr:biopolymer transporter ExbD [Spirochaetaceae bacterium]
MKIKRQRNLNVSDSSALSDLAFLLIVYFIVIAGFNVNKGFILNLPAKDSVRVVSKEEILKFYMDDFGDIFVDGEKKDTAFIEYRIANRIAANPGTAVVLDIAPNAPWQNVVSFVELAETLKIETFSLKLKQDT